MVFLLWGWWISKGHHSEAGFGGALLWWIGQIGGVYAVWNLDRGPD